MILFEGHHHIPFFWLMLLGQDDIDLFYEKSSRYVRNGTEKEPAPEIELDKLQALVRLADRREYVEQYHAADLPLYDDWIYFMQTADFSDRKIYMDLYEISSCHESPERFTDSLRRAIACFDEHREAWYEHKIADTCGHESKDRSGRRRFSDFSETYREMNRKDVYGRFDEKIHLGRKMSAGKKRRLALALLLFIALAAGILLFIFR